MEQLIQLAIFLLKIYLSFLLWIIEIGMKYWRTILVAALVGGIFFAAVYFYNSYTLKIPSRTLIFTLILIWLGAVYFCYEGERDKDVKGNLKTIKDWFEKISLRIEKDLTTK